MKILQLFLLVVALITPTLTSAQSTQPCDGSDHQACALAAASATIGQQAVEIVQLQAQIAELRSQLTKAQARNPTMTPETKGLSDGKTQ